MDEGDQFEEQTRITFEISHNKHSTSPINYALVTYSGSQDGFANIQIPFSRDIAAESFAWKRTYGQVLEVYCHVQFEQYRERMANEPGKEKEMSSTIDLMGPVLHSYWCDCQSLDAYKAVVKSQITQWLEQLEAQQIIDWVIVVLVRPEHKKSPRTKPTPRLEIHDRITADFCTKLRDRGRCIFIMDPRSGLGDADAWHSGVIKFRQLVYDAYETKLRSYEEKLRIARENRSKPGWKLSEYINMRETLATAYQRLGFPEDALLHLDELSAIISQFAAEAASPNSPFRDQCKIPPKKWLGLNIANKSSTSALKESLRIGTDPVSLLDLRSFLFVRQYEVLVELNRAWEVTIRAMPFIQNVNTECKLFDVPMIPGTLDCWTFLTCHEIRRLYQKIGDGVSVTNEQENATLLGLEREKLGRLGFLCGLMPNQKLTNEQRSLTEALSRAMEAPTVSVAVVKLYEALFSAEKFMKTYLELSEMTMGTFKHVGRTRAAKLLGVDIAKFHMGHGSFDKAAGFLLDALKMLRFETWTLPCADVAILYTKCAYQTGQWDQVIKSALLVASSANLDMSIRLKHMDTFMETIATRGRDLDKVLRCDGLFLLTLPKGQEQDTIVFNQNFQLDVLLESKLPGILPIQTCLLVLRKNNVIPEISSRSPVPDNDNFFTDETRLSNSNNNIVCTSNIPIKNEDDAAVPIRIYPGVKCVNTNTSRSFRSESIDISDSAEDLLIECPILEIHPGQHLLTFNHKFTKPDTYHITELRLQYSLSFKMIIAVNQHHVVEILNDPPGCNIVSLSATTTNFWMHSPYDFRLFLTGDHARLNDVLVSIKPAETGCVKIINRNGSDLPHETLLPRSNDHSLQFRLTCSAREVDYSLELLVFLPWRNTPERFHFSFHSPLSITTSSHFCAPTAKSATTLISIAIKNRWKRPVTLLARSLRLDDRLLDAITDSSNPIVLEPASTLRLIWTSQFVIDAAIALLFEAQYSCSGSDCNDVISHSLTYPFPLGLFGSTRLVISVQSSHDLNSTFLVGESVQVSFTVSSNRIDHNPFPVFYQIKYDQAFWTSNDETSGSIVLREAEDALFKIAIVPVKPGRTILPSLRLFYVKDEDIVPIDAFHVYNESTHRSILVSAKQASIINSS